MPRETHTACNVDRETSPSYSTFNAAHKILQYKYPFMNVCALLLLSSKLAILIDPIIHTTELIGNIQLWYGVVEEAYVIIINIKRMESNLLLTLNCLDFNNLCNSPPTSDSSMITGSDLSIITSVIVVMVTTTFHLQDGRSFV